MADLSQLTVGEYLYQLDKRFHLQLSDAQIQAACKSFEDQWFNNASELQSLDAEAFKMLPDIPPSLSSAIMRSFARGATAPEPVVPVYVAPLPPSSPVAPPRRSPSNSNSEVEIKMAHDEEKGGGRPRANSRANMEDVIEKVMAQAQASGNDFVVQGLSNLLKKSIEDSSSTARSNVLRGYLKTLNKSTLRQNATLTREFEMEHARAMAEAEEKAAMEAEEEDRPPSPATELVQSMNNLEIDPNAPGCGICHGQKDKSKTLECGHSFCVCCVHDYVMELVGRKDAVGMKCPKCPAEMTVANIQALLTPDEFNQYLEATLMAFIEQDNLTFKCPNTTCGAIIAVQPMKPMEPPNPMTEKDDDGNLLTSDAWLHFQEFRVRCRVCSTVFCAQCKNIPYHKGHTCATYREFQKARHCRFCNTKLDDANSAKDAPGPGLRDVCTQDECLQKRAVCCGRTKACGCPCNGVRDEAEKDCLPCLKHELEMADEFCAICYVEALKDAPCVQLGGQCNHVFHYQCVVSKLKAGSPGARVSFEFKCCPLCQKPIQHPSLKAVLEPINQMEENVRKKALERLQYEGRERDPAIINANGRFYNDPVAFAMHQYLFYMCHTCKKPYFAGGYQCQEANAPFNPEELVCPSCQPHSVNDCPTHGTDWLAYKCRYCCNFSTWYCWGRSHFCDQCHKSGVWQKLCEFRTGKNKKKIWEYAQCPGLQKAIAPIVADKSLSDADKEAKLEALRSDPLTCPLRLQHPPNGFEYGLGCSMCEEKKYEKLNEEAAKKAKEEAEQKRQALTAVKSALKQHPKGMLFQYQSDLDENGVFHYLGTCGKTQRWSNPADAGFVNITSSGIMQDSAPLSAALGREVVRCVTKPVRNAWMCVDLIDMSLELQRYTLRHYSSWDTECLRNWVIEGSNDGVTWDTLRQHVNDPGLNKKGGTFTWAVDSGGRKYRLFRLLQTGPNSNNHFYLAVSGMEFYGVLSDTVGGADQDEQKFAEEQKVEVIKSFEYAYDFDMNGILYYLGTNCGASKQWTNPAVLGTVIASSSGLADKPPSMPASAICGRELVRCVTQAKPNQWFQIDLKDKKANVTRYTLKHYNSWDTEALRNWRFEASNDGVSWVVLKEHVNDQVLMGKGATATWKIDEAEQKGYFSLFRLYQTGRNSNNHYYLPCSGLELYGTLAQSPTASVPREGIELSYSYDFDANGVFYWIGTRGKRQPWRNPGQAGYVTCSASALATNPPSAPAWAIVGRELCRCVSAASPNMFFDVNLKDKRVRPTAYTIRHYNSWDTEALRNWVFEGSNDGAKWVLIKEHINDPALDKKGATFTWPVVSPGNQAFQIFRIRQTGLNSNNHHYLACSGFELYGHMYEANQPIEEVMSHELKESLPPFKDGTEFRHTFDFDEQGIVYWLGSLGRMREWRNPAQTGLLKVTASPLASQSAPAWAACGREVVRCVTEPKKHTFFCFDFGNLYIVPTAYTLRHYDSWDTEALRSWKLEGSIDGKKWKTLISHKKDAALNAKGASHTWPIKGVTKSYSMFKVTQTGKNSNKHWYLCLSGFEIYGQVYSFRKK